MPNLAATSDRWPLVSVIILCYNQSNFVEEAVHSAFAQDYPSLEILLSDDCSSDDTLTKLSALAANYRGPHQVRARRCATNSGMLRHLYEAAREAKGELIVIAAGDDTSMPNRVSMLVNAWRHTGAAALSSRWYAMNEKGDILHEVSKHEDLDIDARRYFKTPIELIYGAAAAYDRQKMLAISPPDFHVASEDFFFTLMMALRGDTIVFVDQPLVAYREHSTSLTNYGSTQTSIGYDELSRVEKRAQAFSHRLLELLLFFRSAVIKGEHLSAIKMNRLDDDIAYLRYRARWLSASLVERIAALRHGRSVRQLMWIGARIPGSSRLFRIKQIAHARRGTART